MAKYKIQIFYIDGDGDRYDRMYVCDGVSCQPGMLYLEAHNEKNICIKSIAIVLAHVRYYVSEILEEEVKHDV